MRSAIAPKPTLFKTAKAWETWLRTHHRSSDGLWLQIAKAGADDASVTYAEAIDVALCFGWIDGQKKALDDQRWLQRFTPRRAKSLWSKINVTKALALIEAGRMQPAGQAQIAAAQADGRWDSAYDGAGASTVPLDLQAALDANPRAKKFFASIDGANRYGDPCEAHRAVRRHARPRREAPPMRRDSPLASW